MTHELVVTARTEDGVSDGDCASKHGRCLGFSSILSPFSTEGVDEGCFQIFLIWRAGLHQSSSLDDWEVVSPIQWDQSPDYPLVPWVNINKLSRVTLADSSNAPAGGRSNCDHALGSEDIGHCTCLCRLYRSNRFFGLFQQWSGCNLNCPTIRLIALYAIPSDSSRLSANPSVSFEAILVSCYF